MTDLSALLDSNLAGLIIAAALGVLLASFIQWYQFRHHQHSLRTNTAVLLGGEIYAIQRLCEGFLKTNTVALANVKAAIKKGQTLAITIGDYDFPRAIYDRPYTDLNLLSLELGATISELYRMVELSKCAKDNANGFGLEVRDIIGKLDGVSDANQRAAEQRKLVLAQENFLKYVEIYNSFLEQVSRLSAKALGKLERIKGVSTPAEKTPEDLGVK